MTSVSISDLEKNLSRYIREVRDGGEVEVLDRGNPVARITPPAKVEQSALDALVREGVLTQGRGCARTVLERPPMELPFSLLETLLEERGSQL